MLVLPQAAGDALDEGREETDFPWCGLLHRCQGLRHERFQALEPLFRVPGSHWKQVQREPAQVLLQRSDVGLQLGELVEHIC